MFGLSKARITIKMKVDIFKKLSFFVLDIKYKYNNFKSLRFKLYFPHFLIY